jgi:alkyl hydroperoxide reductase subunit AhpF
VGKEIASFQDKDKFLPRSAPLVIPCDTTASWVRVEASLLSKRIQDRNYSLQFSEILVFSGQDNVALNAAVTSSSVGMLEGTRRFSRALTDGYLPYEMNVPGEQEYRGKGVAYCPHCDGPLYKGKRVAVIGGGNSGVEAAIDLAGIVSHVTLIEFDTKLRADAVLQKKMHSMPNVTVITNALSKEVLGADGKVTNLRYEDRANNQMHDVALEGIFVQIGLLPNTDWLKGVIDLSPRGEVIIDQKVVKENTQPVIVHATKEPKVKKAAVA